MQSYFDSGNHRATVKTRTEKRRTRDGTFPEALVLLR
jgi:hypothetical protein